MSEPERDVYALGRSDAETERLILRHPTLAHAAARRGHQLDDPPPDAPGPDTAAGPKLYATLLRAGLPAPQRYPSGRRPAEAVRGVTALVGTQPA
jgi:hypothetical protein